MQTECMIFNATNSEIQQLSQSPSFLGNSVSKTKFLRHFEEGGHIGFDSVPNTSIKLKKQSRNQKPSYNVFNSQSDFRNTYNASLKDLEHNASRGVALRQPLSEFEEYNFFQGQNS